jgi:hypothetical protein
VKALYGLFKTDARYRDMAARVESVVGVPQGDYDPRAS